MVWVIVALVLLVVVVYGFLTEGPWSFRAEFRRDAAAGLTRPLAAPVVTESDIAGLPEPGAAVSAGHGSCRPPTGAELPSSISRPHSQRTRRRLDALRRRATELRGPTDTPLLHACPHVRAAGFRVPPSGQRTRHDARQDCRCGSDCRCERRRDGPLRGGDPVQRYVPARSRHASRQTHRLGGGRRADRPRQVHPTGLRQLPRRCTSATTACSPTSSPTIGPGLPPTARSLRGSASPHPVRDYRDFGGVRLAAHGDARWSVPDGEFTYGEFELMSASYNVSAETRKRF